VRHQLSLAVVTCVGIAAAPRAIHPPPRAPAGISGASQGIPNEATGSVQREGFALHYRIAGAAGPYLVILAGGPGLDVDYLRPITARLAGSYRCVLLEQRGTGRSVLPVVDEGTINWAAYLGDLEALRVHLKQDRLILVGHSWGMMYALAYAGTYPDRARGLITIGSAPISAEYSRVFEDNRESRLQAWARAAVLYWSKPERSSSDPDRALYEWLRAITPADFFDPAKGIEHAMRWDPKWCHARVGDVAARTIWAGLDLRPLLDAITCPVLFVHGYQDVTGEANMLEAKSRIRNATLTFVHRAGHYPWIEQPEDTWGAVMPFLAGLNR
jgi:proline iminopeptidase